MAGDLLSEHPGMPLPLVFVLGIALGAACGLLNGVLVTWGQRARAGRHARDALRVPRPRLPVDRRPPGQRRDAAGRVPEHRHGLDPRHPDPRADRAGRHRWSSASGCATTAPGRELYAIGSNPEGARLAGVRSDRRVLTAFVLAGALAGLGGVLFTARFGTVDATAGVGYELTVIAAAVVGGVAIFGGTGSVYGAALGALLLGTITSSLIVLRVQAFWQQAAIGALLLSAIAFDRLVALRVDAALRRRSARRAELRRRRGAAPAAGADRDRSAARRVLGRWETLLVGLLVVMLVVGQSLSSEFLTTDSFTTGSLDFSRGRADGAAADAGDRRRRDRPVGRLGAGALERADGLRCGTRPAGRADHPDLPRSPARCAAPSTACSSPASGCRRWRSRSARSRCSAGSPSSSSATSR